MKEEEVSIKIVRVLEKYFYIYPEEKSKCRNGRIDFILVCKKSNVVFGLEIKKIDYKRGEDLGKLIKQVIGYVKMEFKVDNFYRKIPIFIAPPISYDLLMCPGKMLVIDDIEYFSDRHSKTDTHHTVNGMLGVFNIGEIRKSSTFKENYFHFVSSNKIIWTSKMEYGKNYSIGLHKINYDHLMQKINS